MAEPNPETRSSSQSKDEKFHSQNRTSRIFHGIRQHLRDARKRKKLIRETNGLDMQKTSPLKQKVALVGGARAQLQHLVSASKGISVYTYICAPGYTVQFSVPGEHGIITNTSNDNFNVKNVEIDTKNVLPLSGFTGRFEWKALKKDVKKANGYNDINAVTGNVEGGNMVSTQQCIPTVTEDAVITCLFYDAGHGAAGLPNRSQCLITITPIANKTWMGNLAAPGSAKAAKPFSRFVLPAPHDCGMNSMDGCNACLHTVQTEHVSEWIQQLPNLTIFKNFSPSSLLSILPNTVYSLTITQTASIKTMLMMGARYFEFRPAKLYPLFKRTSGLRDTYYYTHLNLPGLAFDSFLNEIVQFLDDNQDEIIVIHLRWDGVVKDCARPTTDEITKYLAAACSQATKPLKWADKTSFSQPIDVLRISTQRIILLINSSQYSSYSDAANATLVPAPIITAFKGMITQQQQGADITLLQCQATATNIKEVVAYSVLSSDASNSPLVATKAICDRETLSWCGDHVIKNLKAEKPVVIMNDFFDGGTADTAIGLSQQRLAAP